MSEKAENPPAFPREDYQCDDAPGQRGMSLRDYFAAQALVGFMAALPHMKNVSTKTGGPIDEPMIAGAAYALADAMLQERVKG